MSYYYISADKYLFSTIDIMPISSIGPMRMCIWRLCAKFFYICLIVLTIVSWLIQYGHLDMIYLRIIRGVMLSFMILCVVESSLTLEKIIFPIGRIFLSIVLLMLIYALFSTRLVSELYYVSRTFFWIVGSSFVYRMTLFGAITEKGLKATIGFVVIISTIFSTIFILYSSTETTQNIGIYRIVWCLPFIMIIKNKIMKQLLMIIACFSIVLALKRGAIIAMIVALTSYAYICFCVNKNIKRAFYSLMVGLISLVAIFSASYILIKNKPEFVSNRLKELSNLEYTDKLGSGRGGFYVFLINKYLQSIYSDKEKLLFGNGSRSTQDLLSMRFGEQFDEGAYAHSDWLQFMYDYGLLGIFVIAFLHVWIIKLIISFYIKKHPYTPQLVMCYTIMFLKSIYSGMLFFPQSIYFSIFIAYVYSTNCNRFIETRSLNI